jgi:hypothetical protein
MFIDFELLIIKHTYEFCYRIFFKRTEAKCHFVCNHSQAPYICLDCVYLSFEDFWSHIDRRPQHSLSQISLVLKPLAKSKISQLYFPIVKHDIRGFEVTMHYVP